MNGVFVVNGQLETVGAWKPQFLLYLWPGHSSEPARGDALDGRRPL